MSVLLSEGNTILRPDLAIITSLVPRNSLVLDLGCGNGELLAYLEQHKDVSGRGIELSEAGVLACVKRGVSVRQGRLEEGLADYPSGRFDVVILSQTLPFLSDPVGIIAEMLRVGKRAIVSFPNWGHWRSRWHLFRQGKMPAMPDLGTHWFEAPRWQAFTISDFIGLCQAHDFSIRESLFLNRGQKVGLRSWANLLATTAVFSLGE